MAALGEEPGTRGGAPGRADDAPDGGHAWFVLLSGFTVFGLTFGIIKSFSVFYLELQHHFGTSASAVSWVTSITVATVHVAAPLASAVSARVGHRPVVLVGGLVCSAGLITGSFSRNLPELCLTVGFINGLGYALCWTPTVTMLGLYFERRRPVANAVSSAGECVLTFVLTPLSQLLIDSYSWRGALLILGGLQLHLCVCGALLRPLNTPQESTHANEKIQAEEGGQTLQNNSHKANRKTFKSKILPYVDLSLISDADFMLFSMFGLFAALGSFAPSLFLVPFARSRGVQEYQAAALMSISSVLDLTGRLAFGWIANLRIVKTVHQLTVTVLLLGLVLLLCPLASSFVELASVGAAFGLMFGATVAVHITALADVVGVARLGSALGFFMLIRSLGGLLGLPLAGFFVDQMEDYGAGFLMAGAALIVSALFLVLLEVRGQRSSSHNLQKPEAQTAPGYKEEEADGV